MSALSDVLPSEVMDLNTSRQWRMINRDTTVSCDAGDMEFPPRGIERSERVAQAGRSSSSSESSSETDSDTDDEYTKTSYRPIVSSFEPCSMQWNRGYLLYGDRELARRRDDYARHIPLNSTSELWEYMQGRHPSKVQSCPAQACTRCGVVPGRASMRGTAVPQGRPEPSEPVEDCSDLCVVLARGYPDGSMFEAAGYEVGVPLSNCLSVADGDRIAQHCEKFAAMKRPPPLPVGTVVVNFVDLGHCFHEASDGSTSSTSRGASGKQLGARDPTLKRLNGVMSNLASVAPGGSKKMYKDMATARRPFCRCQYSGCYDSVCSVMSSHEISSYPSHVRMDEYGTKGSSMYARAIERASFPRRRDYEQSVAASKNNSGGDRCRASSWSPPSEYVDGRLSSFIGDAHYTTDACVYTVLSLKPSCRSIRCALGTL